MRTVLFNIGGPALSQLSDTAARNTKAFTKSGALKKRGVAATIGAGLTAASLLGAQVPPPFPARVGSSTCYLCHRGISLGFLCLRISRGSGVLGF